MESYKEMKERHQSEVSALPLAFAFDKAQYLRKLEEWNITPEEAQAGAVIGISNSGFCRAEDHAEIIATFKRIADEERAAIDADKIGNGYIMEMFITELINHEYSYTQDETETLEALGITAEDLIANKALVNGLELAIAAVNKVSL